MGTGGRAGDGVDNPHCTGAPAPNGPLVHTPNASPPGGANPPAGVEAPAVNIPASQWPPPPPTTNKDVWGNSSSGLSGFFCRTRPPQRRPILEPYALSPLPLPTAQNPCSFIPSSLPLGPRCLPCSEAFPTARGRIATSPNACGRIPHPRVPRPPPPRARRHHRHLRRSVEEGRRLRRGWQPMRFAGKRRVLAVLT